MAPMVSLGAAGLLYSDLDDKLTPASKSFLKANGIKPVRKQCCILLGRGVVRWVGCGAFLSEALSAASKLLGRPNIAGLSREKNVQGLFEIIAQPAAEAYTKQERKWAAFALCSMKEAKPFRDGWIKKLIDLISQPGLEAGLKRALVEALGQFRSADSVELLRKCVEGEDSDMRHSACLALLEVGTPEALAVVDAVAPEWDGHGVFWELSSSDFERSGFTALSADQLRREWAGRLKADIYRRVDRRFCRCIEDEPFWRLTDNEFRTGVGLPTRAEQGTGRALRYCVAGLIMLVTIGGGLSIVSGMGGDGAYGSGERIGAWIGLMAGCAVVWAGVRRWLL